MNSLNEDTASLFFVVVFFFVLFFTYRFNIQNNMSVASQMDEQEHYDQRCSTFTLSGQCASIRYDVIMFMQIEFHYVSKLVYILVVPVKRICVFEHSVMTNFNCAHPAIQRGQGSGFLSEGSS